MTISLKTKYIRTDGWRGCLQPINAVGGANDTGSWEDSPCPSSVRANELRGFKQLLRAAGIKYRQTACASSNVFCTHVYVCVAPEDRERALEIAEEFKNKEGIELFYSCKD